MVLVASRSPRLGKHTTSSPLELRSARSRAREGLILIAPANLCCCTVFLLVPVPWPVSREVHAARLRRSGKYSVQYNAEMLL